MVEHIEGFYSQAQLRALRDRDILLQRHVPIVDARPPQIIAQTSEAVAAERRDCERSWVEAVVRTVGHAAVGSPTQTRRGPQSGMPVKLSLDTPDTLKPRVNGVPLTKFVKPEICQPFRNARLTGSVAKIR